MLIEFSKKQKIAIGVSIVAAILIHYFVTTSQEVGALVAKLEKGDVEARVKAAYELGVYGSSAGNAIPALDTAVHDPDSGVRSAAMLALLRIDRDEAIDSLINAFGDRNLGVRMDAAEALERIGTKRALAALHKSENRSQRSYERSQLNGWAQEMRKEYQKKKKKDYRIHKRMYGR